MAWAMEKIALAGSPNTFFSGIIPKDSGFCPHRPTSKKPAPGLLKRCPDNDKTKTAGHDLSHPADISKECRRTSVPRLLQQQFLGARQVLFGNMHLQGPDPGDRFATQKILDTARFQNSLDAGQIPCVPGVIEACHDGFHLLSQIYFPVCILPREYRGWRTDDR